MIPNLKVKVLISEINRSEAAQSMSSFKSMITLTEKLYPDVNWLSQLQTGRGSTGAYELAWLGYSLLYDNTRARQ